jgi:hypothetical protein
MSSHKNPPVHIELVVFLFWSLWPFDNMKISPRPSFPKRGKKNGALLKRGKEGENFAKEGNRGFI